MEYLATLIKSEKWLTVHLKINVNKITYQDAQMLHLSKEEKRTAQQQTKDRFTLFRVWVSLISEDPNVTVKCVTTIKDAVPLFLVVFKRNVG